MSAGQESGSPIRENRTLLPAPLPPDEARGTLAAAAGVSTVGLRPPFDTPQRHSHPVCRAILTLIVALERLETDVPNQPSQQQLKDDPSLHRFTVVFDREGYSPAFLAAMKKKRIACLTYHKHPGEDWPKDEFLPTPVRLASGHETTMQLAER